ncbi:MAG: sugar ABC transporter permease [Planctomycetota bacterium]
MGKQARTNALRGHPLTPYAFMAPALLILGVFFLLAAVQVVYFSFTRYTAFEGPEFVGLENYRRLLASETFWLCLLNSFIYLLVTPALMAISLAAALAVHAGLRWAKGLRLLLFLPVVTPTIVAAVAWRLILNEDSGVINGWLTAVGLPAVRWLSEPPFTLISAMMVTLWKGFGFYMMVFLAGLLAIPKELEEAAAIDGAGRAGTLLHVTLPGLAPVLTLVFIISSISALKVFDELFVTIKGMPAEYQTAVPLVYETAFERGDYGLASAIGITLFVIILVFSLINLRLTGGGKGAADA